MLKKDLALSFTCGADWSAMKAKGASARLCAECDKIVHDLSAMAEDAARQVLTEQRQGLCVRYLYDPRTGEVAFRPSNLVPSANLARRPGWKKALTLAAPMFLQACMGALPNEAIDTTSVNDGGGDERSTAHPGVIETDGGDAGNAHDAATPDAQLDGGAADDGAAKGD